jgi:hypothetical protein
LIFLGAIITVGIIVGIVHDISKKNQNNETALKTEKKETQNVDKRNFRNCFLDMDTGDIIYR